MDNTNPPTLKDLFPDASEEELREYGESLDRYLGIVMRIVERRLSEEDLTSEEGEGKINGGSNINNLIEPNV